MDHQAARSFMNKIVSYDQGIDAGTIKELSEITKNLSSTTSVSPFLSGFGVGASLTGLHKAVSGAMEDVSKDMLVDVFPPPPEPVTDTAETLAAKNML
jgi:hypothetical protein